MAYQQADIDALQAAIGLGAREVRYADGRNVVYRSLAEMKAILTDMKADVAGPAAQTTLGADRTVAGYNSGLSRGTPVFGERWGGGW